MKKIFIVLCMGLSIGLSAQDYQGRFYEEETGISMNMRFSINNHSFTIVSKSGIEVIVFGLRDMRKNDVGNGVYYYGGNVGQDRVIVWKVCDEIKGVWVYYEDMIVMSTSVSEIIPSARIPQQGCF